MVVPKFELAEISSWLRYIDLLNLEKKVRELCPILPPCLFLLLPHSGIQSVASRMHRLVQNFKNCASLADILMVHDDSWRMIGRSADTKFVLLRMVATKNDNERQLTAAYE